MEEKKEVEVPKEVEEPKEKPKEQVELTEVVTETGLAYKLPDGEVVNLDGYRVWIGNLLWKIHKAVA